MRTINERVEGVGGGPPRERGSEREARSEGRSREDDLLIGVVVLGVIVVVLILIIIYCHCKRLGRKGRTEMEDGEGRAVEREEKGRDRSSNMRESAEEAQQSTEKVAPLQTGPEVAQLSVPVKTRKRSMTFSETDEECRRYREDLADSGDRCESPGPTEPAEPFGAESVGNRLRKKSVVTFTGV